MTAIGPTFGDELRAAGCANGVSWNAETGDLHFTGVDADYEARVRAVLDAHDPTKKTADQVVAEAMAAGYADEETGITLPIDPVSQGQITAQGAAAVGVVQMSPDSADAKTFLFPTLDGRGTVVTGAHAAYDLAERCRVYVEGLRKQALGL